MWGMLLGIKWMKIVINFLISMLYFPLYKINVKLNRNHNTFLLFSPQSYWKSAIKLSLRNNIYATFSIRSMSKTEQISLSNTTPSPFNPLPLHPIPNSSPSFTFLPPLLPPSLFPPVTPHPTIRHCACS